MKDFKNYQKIVLIGKIRSPNFLFKGGEKFKKTSRKKIFLDVLFQPAGVGVELPEM